MAHLSRRTFLATTSALAAACALPTELLGKALAAPLAPSGAPTTLQQTILQSATANRGYRTLVSAPGEAYIVRHDILRKTPSPARVANRRSLLYIGHLSDIHIIDAQGPARIEPAQEVAPDLLTDATRPQETLCVNVLAAMVGAVKAAEYSPLTGAPMAAAVNTGDTSDSLSSQELKWAIEALDGVPITPNSGKVGEYEGVQKWSEATYAYHPDDPSNDVWGLHGFPQIPGMLTAAVSQTIKPAGCPAPWYSVFGNHDVVFVGFLPVDAAIRAYSVGDKKAVGASGLITTLTDGWASNPSLYQRMANQIKTGFGFVPGIKSVTSDSGRSLFSPKAFMQMHLDSPALPGPVGHGFTQANIDSGQTWWMADLSPHVVAFGLDTCNQTSGADGAVPQPQFDWLEEQLGILQKQNKMAIILSHHNSFTLENPAQPTVGKAVPLIHADEFIAMLHKYPNMVAWLNGHTHVNTITAHAKDGGGGFWEITTASCIDFPQQQQMVELVDNKDGTMSIFTTVLDSEAPPQWTVGDFSQVGLASLSRELASNSFLSQPLMRRGSPLDRNCELLMQSPFDLNIITDAQLEKDQMIAKARLTAHTAKAVTQ